MADTSITRRRALHYCALAAATASTTGCASWFRRDPRFVLRPTDGVMSFALTEAPELGKGEKSIVVQNFDTSERILVFRRKGGALGATAIECPHKGWDVDYRPAKDQITCPAHGSVFGADGTFESGPAKRSLRRYKVTEAGGRAMIARS